ncbi:putative membrane protein [Prescottella equi 103S]|uniref:Membrane protein n=1 Tax=Rhodococcus hoagii (strain 103S) TaxID=685727 RepID=A0A3S5Y3E5_RHOH1|nr:putative membrane protein [Prescottella equi 103S]
MAPSLSATARVPSPLSTIVSASSTVTLHFSTPSERTTTLSSANFAVSPAPRSTSRWAALAGGVVVVVVGCVVVVVTVGVSVVVVDGASVVVLGADTDGVLVGGVGASTVDVVSLGDSVGTGDVVTSSGAIPVGPLRDAKLAWFGLGEPGVHVDTSSHGWLGLFAALVPWHSVLLVTRSLYEICRDEVYPEDVAGPFFVYTRAYTLARGEVVLIPVTEVVGAVTS